jgi:hypothetical protein
LSWLMLGSQSSKVAIIGLRSLNAYGDDFQVDDGDYEGRDAWRAAFARFALTEQDRPVILEEATVSPR